MGAVRVGEGEGTDRHITQAAMVLPFRDWVWWLYKYSGSVKHHIFCPGIWGLALQAMALPVSKIEQDPVGIPGIEAFLCLPFLVCKQYTPASMTLPEFWRADSNNC